MAFGSTAGAVPSAPKKSASGEGLFVKMGLGSKVVLRIVGEEVIWREYWYKNRPVIPAVLRVTEEGAEYVTADGESNWYDNPLQQYYDTLDQEEVKRKGLYSKPRFAVNVFVREVDEAGAVLSKGTLKLLTQSAGKPGGNHFLGKLVTLNDGAMLDFDTGKPVKLTDTDIRIVTTGDDPQRPNRTILQGPKLAAPDIKEIYDLKSWIKPWPFDAIAELMQDEADYDAIRTKYNLPKFPELKPMK